MNIKELVKDNVVRFDSFRQGNFYYNVYKQIGIKEVVDFESRSYSEHPECEVYQFTVPLEDIGTATLLAQDKAITYMRWIRKAINDNMLVRVR